MTYKKKKKARKFKKWLTFTLWTSFNRFTRDFETIQSVIKPTIETKKKKWRRKKTFKI